MDRRIIAWSTVTAILAALFLGEIFLYQMPDVVEVLDGELSATQAKAIDLLVEMSRLFTSFALGILAALSFFVRQYGLTVSSYTRYDIILITCAVATALLGIYFGHFVTNALIEMLINDFLDFFSGSLVWSVRLQYLFVVLSAASLIAFVAESSLTKDRKNDG